MEWGRLEWIKETRFLAESACCAGGRWPASAQSMLSSFFLPPLRLRALAGRFEAASAIRPADCSAASPSHWRTSRLDPFAIRQRIEKGYMTSRIYLWGFIG